MRIGMLYLGLMSLIVVSGCEEARDVATISPEIVAMDADFVVVGGEQLLTQEGTPEVHLVYDTAFQWVDSASVALRQVELVVFHDDGTERARVTADRGRLDQGTNQMVAMGNVMLVVPGEGRVLRSAELHYDPEGGRIWSDSAFVLEEPGRPPLRGSAFESDLEFRNFQARGRP